MCHVLCVRTHRNAMKRSILQGQITIMNSLQLSILPVALLDNSDRNNLGQINSDQNKLGP